MDENDFILAAYSEYLRAAPEWPENRDRTSQVSRLTSEGPEDATLFIRECFRLVCTKNVKSGYYDFCLRNMVSSPLKKIRIFGKILSIKDRENAIYVEAYDGTGVITVHYKKQKGKDYKAAQFEHYQINKAKDFNADAETRGSEQCTFRDNGGLTSAGQIESSVPMRDESNHKEVNERPLNEPLKVKGFMTAFGIMGLMATRERTESENQTIWKRSMMPSPLFIAYAIELLTEQEYVNNCTALAELLKKRYTGD